MLFFYYYIILLQVAWSTSALLWRSNSHFEKDLLLIALKTFSLRFLENVHTHTHTQTDGNTERFSTGTLTSDLWPSHYQLFIRLSLFLQLSSVKICLHVEMMSCVSCGCQWVDSCSSVGLQAAECPSSQQQLFLRYLLTRSIRDKWMLFGLDNPRGSGSQSPLFPTLTVLCSGHVGTETEWWDWFTKCLIGCENIRDIISYGSVHCFNHPVSLKIGIFLPCAGIF